MTAETATAKGPLVWLDMDQAQLDAAYDQAIWAPNQAFTAERRSAAVPPKGSSSQSKP